MRRQRSSTPHSGAPALQKSSECVFCGAKTIGRGPIGVWHM
jgi:hypothetical protein